MATVPSSNPNAEPSVISTDPPNPFEAEYEAAIAEHKQQAALMAPVRKEYDTLFHRHVQIQARHDKLTATINSHRSTYQHHRRYVIFLSNALLASNTALRTAPKPLSDFQTLVHATLFHKIKLASNTLTDMLVQNKRLDKAKSITFKQDQDFYVRCKQLFDVVDEDCRELDRLHVKVLEAEKKLGGKVGCELVNGKGASCIRNEEREAKRAAAADKGSMRKKKKKGRGERARSGMGKVAQGKQKLDDILEEEDFEEEATA